MEKLTQPEEEALKAIYRLGEANVKAILGELTDPPPYTTLASTIRNLERKGFLKSRMIGNTNLYKPVHSEPEFKQRFMSHVVKDYFENSYKGLVNFFIEQKKLSASELKEILTLIEKSSGKPGK